MPQKAPFSWCVRSKKSPSSFRSSSSRSLTLEQPSGCIEWSSVVWWHKKGFCRGVTSDLQRMSRSGFLRSSKYSAKPKRLDVNGTLSPQRDRRPPVRPFYPFMASTRIYRPFGIVIAVSQSAREGREETDGRTQSDSAIRGPTHRATKFVPRQNANEERGL